MRRIGLFLVLAFAGAAPLLFCGCEAESSADLLLNLEPRSVTLKHKQSAVFTVSGGYDYRWTLSNEQLGTLNKRTGNQVIYTATSTNSGVQILTVNSVIEGASGNNPTNVFGTNQQATAASATATITQIGRGGAAPAADVTSITITPSSAVLTSNQTFATFSIAEGVEAAWSVQNGALGDPDTGAGSSFTYTATTFPTSAVTQVIKATYRNSAGTTLTSTANVTQRAQ